MASLDPELFIICLSALLIQARIFWKKIIIIIKINIYISELGGLGAQVWVAASSDTSQHPLPQLWERGNPEESPFPPPVTHPSLTHPWAALQGLSVWAEQKSREKSSSQQVQQCLLSLLSPPSTLRASLANLNIILTANPSL